MTGTFIDRAASNGVLLFLSRWLAHPLRMGSVVPSSKILCKHIVRCAWPEDDGVVLELGARTGVVSRAFLDAGLPAERLVTLEIDPDPANHLRGNPARRRSAGMRRAQAAGRICRSGSKAASRPWFAVSRWLFTYCIASPLPAKALGPTARREVWTAMNLPPACLSRYMPI